MVKKKICCLNAIESLLLECVGSLSGMVSLVICFHPCSCWCTVVLSVPDAASLSTAVAQPHCLSERAGDSGSYKLQSWRRSHFKTHHRWIYFLIASCSWSGSLTHRSHCHAGGLKKPRSDDNKWLSSFVIAVFSTTPTTSSFWLNESLYFLTIDQKTFVYRLWSTAVLFSQTRVDLHVRICIKCNC